MPEQSAPWPTVLPDDDGIRPAGRPDRCFYCGRKVGQAHRKSCVTVCQTVKYRVLYEGHVVGHFTREEPYSWDNYLCESHKNESSWCKDNALDEMEWEDTALAQRVKDELEDNEHGCSCRHLTFLVDSVVDAGPHRARES